MISHFIHNIPNFALLLLIIGINIVFSIIGLYIVRRFLPLQARVEFNDGIGFIAATTGVLYAILIGLIAVSVVNNFDHAQEDANLEANTIAAIYNLSYDVPSPLRENIQKLDKLYLLHVINDEWPRMRDALSISNIDIINKLNLLVAQYKVQNIEASLTLDKLNESFEKLYNAHKEREKWVQTAVHPDVMIVLLIGALLVIAIHLILGIDFKIHVICMLILDIVLASILFLVVAVDRPYMGHFSVDPIIFQDLLDTLH